MDSWIIRQTEEFQDWFDEADKRLCVQDGYKGQNQMKKKSKKHEPDFFSHAKKSLSTKTYKTSIKKGQAVASELRLKMAREMLGLNQTDLKELAQPEVSKIEKRKDLKISTLEKYAAAMGMKLKISLVSEDDEGKQIAIYG
jgi:hypothetical protein